MKKISIHPLTLLVFLVFFLLKKHIYFILYAFIFLHELSHLIAAVLLGFKPLCLHLYPWGCMLSMSEIPPAKKRLVILSAGVLFNIIMLLLNIFPKENLSLAIFNLIPVMPLDGGVILSILFPRHYVIIGLIFIFAITLLFIFFRIFPTLPILLLVILIAGEKHKIQKNIDLKVLRYFNQK